MLVIRGGMALNIGLDNMPNCEGIQAETEGVYVTQDEMNRRIVDSS
jgi:hypothetical protein